MITTYTCPECRRMLRTTEALPGGTRVQCPQCRTEFDTPEDAPEPPPAPRAANIPAVPRAGAKLVDEGWHNPPTSGGAAPSSPRQASRKPRTRPVSNSRKVILTFVIICLSLAFLVLIFAMAQRRSQSTPTSLRMPQVPPHDVRLHGEWELVEINGAQAFRKLLEFRKDGSAKMWQVNNLPGDNLLFRFRVTAANNLEIDSFDLHGARQVATTYRIEWLPNDEVMFVDIQFADSFRFRRVR